MESGFQNLINMVQELEDTSSQLSKKKILHTYLSKFPMIQKYLNATYNHFFQYRLTHAMALKHGSEILFGVENLDLLDLLHKFQQGDLTGNHAYDMWTTYISKLSAKEGEIVGRILDKDLKCRIGCKMINTVLKELNLAAIPTHEVSLGHKYEGEKVWEEETNWYASRKLDGVRCQAILGNGWKPILLSRQGKPFETLRILEDILSAYDGPSIILDGELSLVEENQKDNFQGLMKEIRRKDHTISNICFHLFDVISSNGIDKNTFAQRIAKLKKIVNQIGSDKLKYVKQIRVKGADHFEHLIGSARDRGWEGLMLRKDTRYKAGRTRDLLKVKEMQDLEAMVIHIKTGTMNIVQDGKEMPVNVMVKAVILHRGSKVGVGSGWSVNQRRFYYKHPEKLIGKIITVQYFEETKNQEGGYGLRFPVCKVVHGEERST